MTPPNGGVLGTSLSPLDNGVGDFLGDDPGNPIVDIKGVELGIVAGRINGESEVASLAPRGGGGGGGFFAPYLRSEEEDADLN